MWVSCVRRVHIFQQQSNIVVKRENIWQILVPPTLKYREKRRGPTITQKSPTNEGHIHTPHTHTHSYWQQQTYVCTYYINSSIWYFRVFGTKWNMHELFDLMVCNLFSADIELNFGLTKLDFIGYAKLEFNFCRWASIERECSVVQRCKTRRVSRHWEHFSVHNDLKSNVKLVIPESSEKIFD